MATDLRSEERRNYSLILDVSTIIKADTTRPTGIHRVVLETALAAIELTGGAVEFTRFDRSARCYRKVEHATLLNIITALTSEEISSDSAEPGTAGRRSHSTLGLRLLARLATVAPSTATHTGAAFGYLRRSARAARSALLSIRPEIQRRRMADRRPCHSSAWSTCSMYCSLGLDLTFNDLNYLMRCKRTRGFRVAMMVHDLIPCMAPQYSTQELTTYFASLIAVSDTVLVASAQTRTDLAVFASDLGMQLPMVETISLSSSLVNATPTRPASLPDSIGSSGFVMFVSTITARKNHHLLLDVWARFLSGEVDSSVPFLIIAGSPGSLSDETMNRLRRDTRLRKRVIHLQGLADPEIAWLYQHCAFTLYPSFYEGWGLPVTESLDFGKVCIASDTTSLPEAGEGLAIHLDPTNREQWAAQILELWSDLPLRSELEGRIRRQHHHRDSVATTAHLLTAIGVETRQP